MAGSLCKMSDVLLSIRSFSLKLSRTLTSLTAFFLALYNLYPVHHDDSSTSMRCCSFLFMPLGLPRVHSPWSWWILLFGIRSSCVCHNNCELKKY